MKWKRKTFFAFKMGEQEIPIHKRQLQPITGPEAVVLYLKLVGKATKTDIAKSFGLSKREIDRFFADLVKIRKIYCDLARPTTYALDPHLI